MNRTFVIALAAALAAGCSRTDDAADPPATRESSGAADSLAQQPGAPPLGEAPAPAADSAAAPSVTAPPAARGPAAANPAATGSGGGAVQPAQGAAVADSATRILTRAAQRYQAVRSLQADFGMTYENPLLRSRTEGAGVLYQKRPDRLLLRFSEPAGDVVLSDGEYFWLFYPSVQADQVVRSPAAASGASGVDLQAQFLGDPTRRFAYTLDGEESVGGRAAWLLTMTPRERMGYRRLRVWIDQRDYLARRFEITEDNSAVRRFELRNLRVDPALQDALFRFDVPAGVRVITR